MLEAKATVDIPKAHTAAEGRFLTPSSKPQYFYLVSCISRRLDDIRMPKHIALLGDSKGNLSCNFFILSVTKGIIFNVN